MLCVTHRQQRLLLRILSIAVLAIGLSACGGLSQNEAPLRKPAPLSALPQKTVVLVKKWSRAIGQGVTKRQEQLTPAIASGHIFAAGTDGKVIALDRDTGAVIWRRILKNTRISGGVSVAANRLLLGTLSGQVIALDAQNGHDLWTATVSSEVLATPATDGTWVVVKSIDDTVIVLDAKTGALRWQQKTAQPPLTLRGLAPPIITRETVLVGYANGEVKAFRLNDGLPLWTAPVATPKGRTELERMVDIDGLPVIVGDTVFAASYQGQVAGLNVYRGQLRWSREASSYQALAAGFGSLYVTDQDSYLSAWDQRTGAVNWRQAQLQHRGLSAPATFSSYVAVGDQAGYLHVLSQVDGQLVGRIKVSGSAIKAQPQVEGDRLYVLTAAGQLVALQPR